MIKIKGNKHNNNKIAAYLLVLILVLSESINSIAGGIATSSNAERIEILAQSIQADGVDSDSNKPIELTWGVDIVDNDVVAATIN